MNDKLPCKRGLLELQKKVLTAVSEDKSLFRKELAKAVEWLDGECARELYVWAGATYGVQHGGLIRDVFLDAGWRAVSPVPMEGCPSDN